MPTTKTASPVAALTNAIKNGNREPVSGGQPGTPARRDNGQFAPKPDGQPVETVAAQPNDQQSVQQPQQNAVVETPKEYQIEDDAVIVNQKGERLSLKDVEFYSGNRNRVLQERSALDTERKKLEGIASDLRSKVTDPAMRDYLYYKDQGYGDDEARSRALKANDANPEPKPVVEDKPPEAPRGAVPGDPEYEKWQADVAVYGADQAIRKYVSPLLEAEENRKKESNAREQSNRIADENVSLIRHRMQEFTDVDVANMTEDERGGILDKTGEILARRGIRYDNRTNRWNTRDGRIDENTYALAVEQAAASFKPSSKPTPASIVSDHMNNGKGLVPTAQPSKAQPPGASIQQQPAPRINKGQPTGSGNKLKNFLGTGQLG